MRPFVLAEEPTDFDAQVRKPGRQYVSAPRLKENGSIYWNDRDYWKRACIWLMEAYGAFCAYTGFRIRHFDSEKSVDHIKPKQLYPDLAYEWTNLVLCGRRLNSVKRVADIPITMFELNENDVLLNTVEFRVYPNPSIDPEKQGRIRDLIQLVGLNHPDLCHDRRELVEQGDLSVIRWGNPYIHQQVVLLGLFVE